MAHHFTPITLPHPLMALINWKEAAQLKNMSFIYYYEDLLSKGGNRCPSMGLLYSI